MTVSVKRVIVTVTDADTGEELFQGTPDPDGGDRLVIVRAQGQPAILDCRVHDMSTQLKG